MPRLDAVLVEKGLARSRERAKEMIKSGAVTVDGVTVKKPAAEVTGDEVIESAEKELFVGRGALKLQKAIECFHIDLTGKVCLDIGASTGGFTEFMLKCGAEKVYAVDVGTGQLAPSLRADSRVVNMENTDIRSVSAEDIGGFADFISADVSFISLTRVLPQVYALLAENSQAAVLIKPQFEAGRRDIGKGGIVKDRKVHIRILSELDEFAKSLGFQTLRYTFSPVKGGSGNIEYLVLLQKTPGDSPEHDFRAVTEEAFGSL